MSTLVEGMLVGSVGFGESIQAGPANYSAEDAMARSIVRLECENEELRASLAMVEAERDLLRVKLTATARSATLEEVRDSVREKYDPEYEFGGGQDE